MNAQEFKKVKILIVLQIHYGFGKIGIPFLFFLNQVVERKVASFQVSNSTNGGNSGNRQGFDFASY